MRRLALASLALAALTSTALAAPPAAKGPWDGFGEGSWVSMKTTSKVEMAGNAMPGQEQETRQTLVKVTDAEWTVRTEIKTGDTWGNATEVKIPRKPPEPKQEDLGTENVSVEGKDYSCKKTRSTVGGQTTTSWTNESAGLLKSESEGNGTSTSMIVTALAKKAKAGSKDVTCREMKMTSKVTGGGDSTITMLTSEEVPAMTVRMEMSTVSPQMKMTNVTEVTGFEKK